MKKKFWKNWWEVERDRGESKTMILRRWTLKSGVLISWDLLEIKSLRFKPGLKIRWGVGLSNLASQALEVILMRFNWPEVREIRLQALLVVQWGDGDSFPKMVGGSGEELELVRLSHSLGYLSDQEAGHEDVEAWGLVDWTGRWEGLLSTGTQNPRWRGGVGVLGKRKASLVLDM